MAGEADDEEGEFDPDDFDQFVNNVVRIIFILLNKVLKFSTYSKTI